MAFMRGHGLLGVAVVSAFAAACGGGAAGGMGGAAGGTAGAAGGVTGAAGLGGGAGSGVGGASDWNACVEMPAPLRTSGTILQLSIDPMLDGKPFVYGEPNRLGATVTGTVTPLNFRFYVSQVRLLTTTGGSVAVDVVTAAGLPEPYDVHLFNAEDESSRALRVLAPPGTYTGIEFVLGLNNACNTSSMVGRVPPLTDTSQMTWGPLGYLFLRFEALLSAIGPPPDGGAELPQAIHMGGAPGTLFAPVIRVEGALSVPAGAAVTRSLRVVMEQIFVGATMEADVTTAPLPGGEVINGERLRRNALSPAPVHVWSVMTARACAPAIALAVALVAAGCDASGPAPAPLPLVDDKLPAGFPGGIARHARPRRQRAHRSACAARQAAVLRQAAVAHAGGGVRQLPPAGARVFGSEAGVGGRRRPPGDAQRARAGEPGVG